MFQGFKHRVNKLKEKFCFCTLSLMIRTYTSICNVLPHYYDERCSSESCSSLLTSPQYELRMCGNIHCLGQWAMATPFGQTICHDLNLTVLIRFNVLKQCHNWMKMPTTSSVLYSKAPASLASKDASASLLTGLCANIIACLDWPSSGFVASASQSWWRAV